MITCLLIMILVILALLIGVCLDIALFCLVFKYIGWIFLIAVALSLLGLLGGWL